MPYVIETIGRSKKEFDINSKLYNDSHIVILSGDITQTLSTDIISQLLYLDTIKSKNPIKLYITSNGGCIYSGLAIKNTIDSMTRKVDTLCIGMCASMGAYLLFCGTGTRKALKDSRIMIHSASSGYMGTYHDLKIDMKETEYLQNKMMEHIAGFSDLTIKEVEDMTIRDKYLTPYECVKYKFIDTVI